MLAAGENPEWIARQLGHADVSMLVSTYSRFVPNLTRKDGSAFLGLLAAADVTPAPGSPEPPIDPLPPGTASLPPACP